MMAETSVNEATTQLTESLRETYQTVAENAVAAQERSVKFAQGVFESGIEELRSQAGTTQTVIQTVAEQSERQRQAFQRLARESVEAYINFMFAPFSFYRKGFEAGRETMRQFSEQ
jgi:hypothetical protein